MGPELKIFWQTLFYRITWWFWIYSMCIRDSDLGESAFRTLETIGIESSVNLTGTISKHPKKDEYELQVSSYQIVWLAKDYPLGTKEDHGPEFLFDNRHLYLRSKSQIAIQNQTYHHQGNVWLDGRSWFYQNRRAYLHTQCLRRYYRTLQCPTCQWRNDVSISIMTVVYRSRDVWSR